MFRTTGQGHDRDHSEQGFTLIELMVVVLIIAILLAIAIPTFLGARNTANSRAAQSNLRNALTAEQTYYTGSSRVFQDTASAADITALQGVESNLNWAASVGSTAKPNSVAAAVATTSVTGDSVLLQAYGKDGKCYTIQQVNQGTSSIAAGTSYNVSNPSTAGACSLPSSTVAPQATGNASSNVGANFYPAW